MNIFTQITILLLSELFKTNFNFETFLIYRNVVKTVEKSPYTLHPVSPNVNILNHYGAFVKIKKMILTLTKLQTLDRFTSFSTNVLFETLAGVFHHFWKIITQYVF